MTGTPELEPSAMGVKAYQEGIHAEDNPFDASEQPDEWDEWDDGWATARLDAFDPWMLKVDALLGDDVKRAANFDQCFDNGMTPEEAVEENRIEVEKRQIADSADRD